MEQDPSQRTRINVNVHFKAEDAAMMSSDSAQNEKPHVAVIGGGISGLMCARTLSQKGMQVSLFEVNAKLGGQIKNITLEGQIIDVGAEAIHLSAPGMKALLDELELVDPLVQSNPGSSWLWGENGLRVLPSGVGPSGPRHLRPVLEAKVLSLKGLLRAGLEPFIPRSKLSGDVAVGSFLRHRFGGEVADRLLDPILGSLHAGNIYKLSLRAVTPELAQIATSGKSIMISRRGRKNAPPMSFATWPEGLTTLVMRMLNGLDVNVRTGTSVTSINSKGNRRYELELTSHPPIVVDGVVLAVPARIAADLLATLAPEPAELLQKIRYASVATTILAFPKADLQDIEALSGNGLLIPSKQVRLLKAATFLSRKWSHLATSKFYFIRLSSGRIDEDFIEKLDDASLVEKLQSDLREATGITTPPTSYYVQRWPNALPQLEVNHLALISEVRDALKSHPAIALAGASYDGIGISACLRSGERAALACVASIAEQTFNEQ